MKTLVLSLLRLGDFIQHQQAFEDENTHFLVNDLFYPQLKHHPRMYFFSRRRLQKILVEKNYNWMHAFVVLEREIQFLKKLGFDRVIDASHTHLSRAVVSLVQDSASHEKNPWLPYLDLYLGAQASPVFHGLSLIARAAGKNPPMLMAAMQTRIKRKILFQVTSSDPKKNMELTEWRQMIKELFHRQPHLEISILTAPEDKEKCEQMFPDEKIVSWDWPTLESRIDQFDALVSLDTSVLHLAAKKKVPTFGIFLGSANAMKSAPYLLESQVMTSTVSCYPCDHHQTCPKASHLCEQSFSRADLVLAIESFILNQTLNRPRAGFNLFVVESNQGEFFLRETNASANSVLQQKLAQRTWAHFLDEKPIDAKDLLDLSLSHQQCHDMIQDLQKDLDGLQTRQNHNFNQTWIQAFQVFQKASDFQGSSWESRLQLQESLIGQLSNSLQSHLNLVGKEISWLSI